MDEFEKAERELAKAETQNAKIQKNKDGGFTIEVDHIPSYPKDYIYPNNNNWINPKFGFSFNYIRKYN